MTDSELSIQKQSDIASRGTPLIRNDWYVACLAQEVTRKPMRRTILEQDLVFYRREDGSPVALQNRCAHRSYPLHLGELKGDRIVCGYHGIEYGVDGRCAHVPSLGGPNSAVRVRSYPVREIGPFIWIWTGDPGAIREDKLIAQPWFVDGGWRYVSGYFHMKANYLGLKENVNDLTHFPFVHTFAKGQVDLIRSLNPQVEVLPDQVVFTHRMENFPVQSIERNIMRFEGPVSESVRSITPNAAMVYALRTHTDSSNPPRVSTQYIVHCTTPESQTVTHYFWAISRNFGLDNRELDEEGIATASTAFKEDVVVLEEIELLIGRDNRPGFREKILATDASGIHVMRLIARIAEAEAQQSSSPTGQTKSA